MRNVLLIMLLSLIPFLTYGKVEIFDEKVYSLSELNKAKQEAISEEKPLTFIYTDKDSDCPLCRNASEMILDELGRDTVGVYVNKKNNAPESVAKLLSSKGKYIPKAAIFDASLDTDIGLIIYETIKKDGDEAFEKVQDAIKKLEKDARQAAKLLRRGKWFERQNKHEDALNLYKKAGKLGNIEARQEAERMSDHLEEGLAAANEKREKGDYYKAVKIYQKIISMYGREHAEDAVEALSAMKKDDHIRREVSAEMAYHKAKERKDKKKLQSILEKYPDTAAADKARKALAE